MFRYTLKGDCITSMYSNQTVKDPHSNRTRQHINHSEEKYTTLGFLPSHKEWWSRKSLGSGVKTIMLGHLLQHRLEGVMFTTCIQHGKCLLRGCRVFMKTGDTRRLVSLNPSVKWVPDLQSNIKSPYPSLPYPKKGYCGTSPL